MKFEYLCKLMIEHLLIALGLAMDCFAVSVVVGVIVKRKDVALMIRLAFLFGLFQALMPLAGWFLASRFHSYIEAVDHWIAFGMLAFIGIKMIADSFKAEDEARINPADTRTQLALAVATSIDALAVGISYACTGYERLSQISVPLVVIGLVSFAMSVIGFTLGRRFGETVNKKMRPELLGGVILLGIGIKILVEHLG